MELIIFLTSLDGKPCKDEFSFPQGHDQCHAKGIIAVYSLKCLLHSKSLSYMKDYILGKL